MTIKNTSVLILIVFVSTRLMGRSDSTKTSPLSVSAFLDFYYAWDFNDPASRDRAILANASTHVFSHNRHNEFALNNGIIFLHYAKEKTRGALSVHTGTFVQTNYANEPTIFKLIYEAYAGVQIRKNLWLDAGIFSSHIGAESAISMNNYTLSRSIMADNTPYYESGVKLTYSKNENLCFTFLVLNGWQNIRENNDNKAIGTQLQIRPVKNLLLNSSTFIGKETPAYDSLPGMRYFHDFYAEWKLKRWSVLAAFDIGLQERSTVNVYDTWYNSNLKIRYLISPKIAVAARAEYYHDKQGVIINPGTPGGFQTFAPSLNIDFHLYENILWRIEGRLFDSKYSVYQRGQHLVKDDAFILTSLSIKLQ